MAIRQANAGADSRGKDSLREKRKIVIDSESLTGRAVEERKRGKAKLGTERTLRKSGTAKPHGKN